MFCVFFKACTVQVYMKLPNTDGSNIFNSFILSA
jgi:hypothetical protein